MSNPAPPRKPPTAPKSLASVTEIAEMAGVSRSRAGQLADKPDFPAPKDKLSVGRVWKRSEVAQYLKDTRPRQTIL